MQGLVVVVEHLSILFRCLPFGVHLRSFETFPGATGRHGNQRIHRRSDGDPGDEHHVLLSADTNGDGKPDVWMTDTTGDGVADVYQFDTTGDGTIDVTVVEGAEEPGTDRLVIEGDGGHPQQV